MEELLLVHDGLKEQEFNFREQCKSDLNLLKNKLQEIENGTSEEEEDRLKEYEEQKEAVMKVRLQLAKKNRAIASLTRQLDDVPGRSELTQYQRRFMELYNQGLLIYFYTSVFGFLLDDCNVVSLLFIDLQFRQSIKKQNNIIHCIILSTIRNFI